MSLFALPEGFSFLTSGIEIWGISSISRLPYVSCPSLPFVILSAAQLSATVAPFVCIRYPGVGAEQVSPCLCSQGPEWSWSRVWLLHSLNSFHLWTRCQQSTADECFFPSFSQGNKGVWRKRPRKWGCGEAPGLSEFEFASLPEMETVIQLLFTLVVPGFYFSTQIPSVH